MNLNQLLIKTLSGHGPVRPDTYDGNEEKYLTFNFPDERGAAYGDNKPHKTLVDVQVHLYLSAEAEYQSKKLQICRELKAAGFCWPRVTILLERDPEKRHIIFETQIKTKIQWEE